MTAVEPYTEEEFYEDCREWSHATVDEKAAAFDLLLTAAGAVAVNRQIGHLVKNLRAVRAIRDAS